MPDVLKHFHQNIKKAINYKELLFHLVTQITSKVTLLQTL